MIFRVFTVLNVDEEENILPIDEDGYCECIQELLENLIYDVDGIKIKNIKVTKDE
jgi:hypothetical protein|tara:strand:- start:67 stop:231 length:165 start_codon:yes stop_codon:yes gene_type:complete